jgi:type II secretory pathway pseudopilin PulG
MTQQKRYAMHHHRQGAALIELVAALFVISVGAMGVVQSYVVGMDKARIINEYDIATRILTNELEHLRAQPFATLEETAQRPFQTQTPELSRLVNAEGTNTIALPYPNLPDLKQVTVRLRWTGEHGRTITKQFTTFLARKE